MGTRQQALLLTQIVHVSIVIHQLHDQLTKFVHAKTVLSTLYNPSLINWILISGEQVPFAYQTDRSANK